MLLGRPLSGNPRDSETRDLPRNSPPGGGAKRALIGDPRNDENVIVSQLHSVFLRFHNSLVDLLHGPHADFHTIQRLARWHYQWVVLHDFLPILVGDALTTKGLKDGPRFYHPEGQPFIPVEFADAAYRYGHSQIKADYQLRDSGPRFAVFPDLAGFRPLAAEHSVDWRLLFDVPVHPPAQRAKPIDGQLPTSLIRLPESITGTVEMDAYRSLAARDLQRGQGTGLPSGEALARALGETPLWLYILREAAVQGGGDRLGAVGGRIVAEVLVEIVRQDPESYLSSNPSWRPTLASHEAGTFKIRDLLLLAC